MIILIIFINFINFNKYMSELESIFKRILNFENDNKINRKTLKQLCAKNIEEDVHFDKMICRGLNCEKSYIMDESTIFYTSDDNVYFIFCQDCFLARNVDPKELKVSQRRCDWQKCFTMIYGNAGKEQDMMDIINNKFEKLNNPKYFGVDTNEYKNYQRKKLKNQERAIASDRRFKKSLQKINHKKNDKRFIHNKNININDNDDHFENYDCVINKKIFEFKKEEIKRNQIKTNKIKWIEQKIEKLDNMNCSQLNSINGWHENSQLQLDLCTTHMKIFNKIKAETSSTSKFYIY